MLDMEGALNTVASYVEDATFGHLVTFTNVHLIVEARKDPKLLVMMQSSDLNCPDGRPISWVGNSRYPDQVGQVSGPDFMPEFLGRSVASGYRHFLYGGASGVAQDAAKAITQTYPGIIIAGTYTPPFRPLTPLEDDEVCQLINDSGAQLVWVCLGCPKQERWIFEHRKRLKASVLLAVGQAIDILAGSKTRAPAIFRISGMEWVYRLMREPRRLWRRYLVTNSLFLFWLIRDVIHPLPATVVDADKVI